MPTVTVQSAAMRKLRRDLEARRTRAALAPARGVAKRVRPSPPPLSSAPVMSSFSKGAHVRVRTRVGTMPTGQGLVLWLSALVVSAVEEEEDGYLGVVYTHYKNPRSSDPFCTVRVPKTDVKNMPPPPAAGCSDVTAVIHSARPPSTAPLRPTVAGKKPSLLKKMEGEMRRRSDAILASWR